MHILGISAYYHDSAACLIHNDKIIAAAQEERFTRKKHDPSFPAQAVKYCLQEANISLDDITYIGFYDKPFLKFERLLETYLSDAPFGFKSFALAIPLWLKEKLFLKDTLIKELASISNERDSAYKVNKKQLEQLKRNIHDKLLFGEHHVSHAASCFYPSPYQRAAILTNRRCG